MITYDNSDPPGPFGHQDADHCWNDYQRALGVLEARSLAWAPLDSDPNIVGAALVAAYVLGTPVASYQKRHKDRNTLSNKRTRGAIRMRAHEARVLFEDVERMQDGVRRACKRVTLGHPWDELDSALVWVKRIAETSHKPSTVPEVTQSYLKRAHEHLRAALVGFQDVA